VSIASSLLGLRTANRRGWWQLLYPGEAAGAMEGLFGQPCHLDLPSCTLDNQKPTQCSHLAAWSLLWSDCCLRRWLYNKPHNNRAGEWILRSVTSILCFQDIFDYSNSFALQLEFWSHLVYSTTLILTFMRLTFIMSSTFFVLGRTSALSNLDGIFG
jgi:hypothetical protein